MEGRKLGHKYSPPSFPKTNFVHANAQESSQEQLNQGKNFRSLKELINVPLMYIYTLFHTLINETF